MRYHQITPAERYMPAALQSYSNALITRITDRHRSTIVREFRRNCAKLDGAYRHSKGQERTKVVGHGHVATASSAAVSGNWSKFCCARSSGLFKTITVDNGPEFHGYKEIEHATGVVVYFANPYCSRERGTNENTNGLIRQYLRKRTSMKHLTQDRCNTIASSLNNRPRKRHGFRTPLDCLAERFTLS